ncbi:MAG TPA: hypothetical protein VNE39_03595 [Planctomycetota bacterium]|nr:hypothetical protein [Planctomycetota bacterium]
MPHHDEVEFAALTAAQTKQVAKLERKLGVVILAYQTPLRPAPLTDKQVAALQKAEAAMPGVCLVAYKAPTKG